MANTKEIVTKAVIGKTKKSFTDNFEVKLDQKIDNVLGCWIINHNFSGYNNNGKVDINGSYDVNIWYAYDNNTKTNVVVRNYSYNDSVNVKLKEEESLTDNHEIMVRSLKNPNVDQAKVDDQTINLVIERELGVEIVGDMLVRINTVDDYEEYDDDLDIDVKEDYLQGVNQK